MNNNELIPMLPPPAIALSREQVHIGRFLNVLMKLNLVLGENAIILYWYLEQHFTDIPYPPLGGDT